MGSRRGSRGPGRPSPRTKVSPGTHQAAVSAPERQAPNDTAGQGRGHASRVSPRHGVPSRAGNSSRLALLWQTPVQAVSAGKGWYSDRSHSSSVRVASSSSLQPRALAAPRGTARHWGLPGLGHTGPAQQPEQGGEAPRGSATGPGPADGGGCGGRLRQEGAGGSRREKEGAGGRRKQEGAGGSRREQALRSSPAPLAPPPQRSHTSPSADPLPVKARCWQPVAHPSCPTGPFFIT